MEWLFLKAIMLRLSFCPTWVALVMKCFRSISYSILVNGDPMGPFLPTKGFRQEDPLSSYLFLFYSKGLICLLNSTTGNGDLQGIHVCKELH